FLRSCPDKKQQKQWLRKGDGNRASIGHPYEFHSPPGITALNLRSSPFYPGPRITWRRAMQGPRTTFIYLAVVFGLLVIPRALQRFRLPAPLTCFAFGIIVAGFFKPLVTDSVVQYLSTLGIAALFLFAGLEVDLAEPRRQAPSLAANFAVRGLILVAAARITAIYLHLGWQVDCLIALALLTPST